MNQPEWQFETFLEILKILQWNLANVIMSAKILIIQSPLWKLKPEKIATQRFWTAGN